MTPRTTTKTPKSDSGPPDMGRGAQLQIYQAGAQRLSDGVTGAGPTCFPKQINRARRTHPVSPLTTLTMRAAGATVTIAKSGKVQ